MHGNVLEWCQDNYGICNRTPIDGSVWTASDESVSRILRGGAWDVNPWHCRSAYRSNIKPVNRLSFIGFRVSCSAPRIEAHAIFSKSISEELKQVAAGITAKRTNLTVEEARELAKRGLRFKQEQGKLPSLTAADPWEKRMAEGIAFLQRRVQEEKDA